MESRWVTKELGLFFAREDSENNQLVIPILLDDVSQIGFLRDRIHVRLSDGDSVAVAKALEGVFRDRRSILVRFDPAKPFTISAEVFERVIDVHARTIDESLYPFVIVESEGFLGALEWQMRHCAGLCKAEEDAGEFLKSIHWYPGIRDNLSLVAQGLLRWCAPVGRRALDFRSDLETVWNRFFMMVLTRVPGFNIGRPRSYFPFPPEHSSYWSWFKWADDHMGKPGDWHHPEVRLALGAQSKSLLPVDLVKHDSTSTFAKVSVTEARVPFVAAHFEHGRQLDLSELFTVWAEECVPQLGMRLVYDSTYSGVMVDPSAFDRFGMSYWDRIGPP